MRNGFYTKLALNNIRKNGKTYFPYMLAGSATVMMFYDMLYLMFSKEVANMSDSAMLRYVLFLGCFVTGIFSFILLMYINSFLIKRRKKEFGLFNILGMEKKHIARVMLIETLLTTLMCIGLGLAAGMLFSKLALLLLLKILGMEATFGFEVPIPAVAITVLLFGAAFLLNLIYNVFQVHVSKPVELLKGSNVGEKEPRTKWLLALIGAAALGSGYYIAITTQSPLAALNLFFVAVILVIIGTYCLFTAGSIAVLKILRRNKRFYYRTNPFIAVSGMIYRMKQNAAGLASICILSTAVIIMLSSTISLYAGMEDVIRNRFSRDISVSAYRVNEDGVKQVEALVSEVAEEAGLIPRNAMGLRYASDTAVQQGATFIGGPTATYNAKNATSLTFMSVDEYNRLEGKQATLAPGEVFVYIIEGQIPGDTLDFNGYSLRIRSLLKTLKMTQTFNIDVPLTNNYVIIAAGEADIARARLSLTGQPDMVSELDYEYLFNLSDDLQAQSDFVAEIKDKLMELSIAGYANAREPMKQTLMSLYGVLFFLGLFLGTLFILGTVLIIYYKQISEGFDDKARFAIMLKVGLSHPEIKKTIRFQVLSVFFLPLAIAVVHIAAAFPVINKLLALLNLTNTPLFALCTGLTILVFGVCYSLIYLLTARTYYNIVR